MSVKCPTCGRAFRPKRRPRDIAKWIAKDFARDFLQAGKRAQRQLAAEDEGAFKRARPAVKV